MFDKKDKQPSQEADAPTETTQGISVNLDNDSSGAHITPDTQRYFTDAEPMERVFLFAFCGYRVKYFSRKNTAAEMLSGNAAPLEQIKEYYSDPASRMMNESGAIHLHTSFLPLIDKFASTSSISELELWRLWRWRIRAENRTLLRSVRNGDPYQYRLYFHRDVISILCSMYQIGMKGRNGFTMTKFAETFMTIFKGGMGLPLADQPKTLLDKLGDMANKLG